MFCQKCGKPSETPVCPECAAAETPVEAPVAEPVVEAVAPVEAPAEEVATAVEEPAIELGIPEEAPKKKSKKGVWIALVAVVAAVGVAAFAFWPTLSHLFQSPDAYLQEVTQESLATYTDDVADLYAIYLKGEAPELDYNNVNTKFSLKLNDGLAGMLATALQSQGINLTAETLKSMDLTVNATVDGDPMKPDLVGYDLGVGLGGKELLTLNCAVDMKTSLVYLAVPRLSAKALKVDLKQYGIDLATMNPLDLMMGTYSLDSSVAADDNYVDFGTDYEDYYDDEDLYGGSDLVPPTYSNSVLGLLGSESFAALQAALPEADKFQAMLDGFIEVALEQITNVEKTTQDVTVAGHTQSQTALVATIDATTLGNMAKAVLNQAQNDATLKQMLDAVDAFAAANGGETGGLHGQMVAAIPELIAELDSFIAEDATAESLKLTTYVDGDDVMGWKMNMQGMDLLTYTTVKDGGIYYYQVSSPLLAVSASVSGSYTEEGNTTKGYITLTLQGVDITLDYEYSDNSLFLRFAPPAELLNSLLSEMGVPAGVLTDNVALELSAQTGNATVTLPQESVDLTDQTQLMTWVTEAMGKLPELLADLGIPEDMVNQLLADALVGSL